MLELQLHNDQNTQEALEHEVVTEEKHVEGEEGFARIFPALFLRATHLTLRVSRRRQRLRRSR